jgi:hypothetical protein
VGILFGERFTAFQQEEFNRFRRISAQIGIKPEQQR